MRILYIAILVMITSMTSVAQVFFIFGNPVTCNGASDGYVEFELMQVNNFQYLSVVPPFIYQWSTGQNTQNIYNLSTGTYNLTLYDAIGNQNVIQAIIDEPDSISVEGLFINPNCENCSDGIININVTGGSPPFMFNWSTGETSQNISNLLYGGYSLIVNDSKGCEKHVEYFILHNPPDSQLIVLETGWNMFSSFKGVITNNLDTLLSSIEGNYSIVKNWEGEVFMPQYGVNTIDTVELEYGFQIKMILADTLMITGTTYNPEDLTINLPSGWCMIGYPRYIDGNITEMMSSIVNHILIMKNENGASYWPLYGVNQINIMHPGDAYQIKTDTLLNFIYPAYGSNL